MGQIKLMTSLILIGLFCISILVFAGKFALDNDSAISVNNDSDLMTIKANILSNQTNLVTTDFNESSKAFSGSTFTGDNEETTGGEQFKVGMFSSIAMMKSALTTSFKKIFGEDASFGIFLTALGSVLLYIFGLYAIKSWRGNPD